MILNFVLIVNAKSKAFAKAIVSSLSTVEVPIFASWDALWVNW